MEKGAMRNGGSKRDRVFFTRHRSTLIMCAIGVIINVTYMLNSYLGNRHDFAQHLGGNPIDHLIIILLLPLFFSVGYLADRSRDARDRLEAVLERETYISNSLQAVFYPRIRQIKGYRLAARYRSVLQESELGGDNYDVFSLGTNRTAVVIADVSGKGLRAAVLGAFAKSVIRAYLHERSSLSTMAASISSAVYHEHGPDQFVTAFIGVLDEPSGAIHYVNAGHPGPLHVSTDKGVEILRAESMPLGIFADQEFVEGEVMLLPGDHLILYTDGLYELRAGREASPETIADEVGRLLPTDADTLAARAARQRRDPGRGHPPGRCRRAGPAAGPAGGPS